MGSKKFNKAEFGTASDVTDAARMHDSLPDSDLRRRLSAEASAAMAEIEDVFACRHPDALIDWVKSSGMTMEVFSDRLKKLPAGGFMHIQGEVYVKTPTKEFQRADAYLNRLEKSVLENYRNSKKVEAELDSVRADFQAVQAELDSLNALGFWAQIKRAFKSLRGKLEKVEQDQSAEAT